MNAAQRTKENVVDVDPAFQTSESLNGNGSPPQTNELVELPLADEKEFLPLQNDVYMDVKADEVKEQVLSRGNKINTTEGFSESENTDEDMEDVDKKLSSNPDMSDFDDVGEDGESTEGNMIRKNSGQDEKGNEMNEEQEIGMDNEAEVEAGSSAAEESDGNKTETETVKLWVGEYRWGRARLCGLENLGNTCYLNSVLQALNNCPHIVEMFCRGWPAAAPPVLYVHPAKRARHHFVNHFADLLFAIWNNRRKGCSRDLHVRPSGVTRGIIEAVPEFQLYSQQDAQEALNYILNELHDELTILVPAEYHPARRLIKIIEREQKEADSRQLEKESSHDKANDFSLDDGSCAQNNMDTSINNETTQLRSENNNKTGETKPILRQFKEKYAQSIISDTFQSLLAQRVVCKQCGYSSRSLEEYLELSLAMPSKNQIKELKKGNASNSSDNSGMNSPSSDDGKSGISRFTSGMVNMAKSVLGMNGHSLSLEDCLREFFSSENLEGEEQYYCEKCKSKQDASKAYSLAHLPEVMCFHLKRFNKTNYTGWGLGSQKNTTLISYPLRGLDLKPYLYKPDPSLLNSDSASDNEEYDKNCASNGSTLYDLFGVVRHSGGINGGHYISNCKNPVDGEWYEFDDEFIRHLPNASVHTTSSEAYLLFYAKRPSEAQIVGKQNIIDQYLTPSLQRVEEMEKFSKEKVYVSLYWALKWNTFTNPGVVCNLDVACEHGFMQPSTATDASQRVLAVTKDVWGKLCSYYGQGPVLSSITECKICRKRKNEIEQRRLREQQRVQNDDSKKDTVWYLISTHWVTQWKNFVQNNQQKTGRGTWMGVPPPGEVNNKTLLDENGRPRKNLKLALHYRGINKKVWDFFMETYGGGPVIMRRSLDIYEKEVQIT